MRRCKKGAADPFTAKRSAMTREELSKEVQGTIKSLEDYSKQLTATLDVLKRTASQDANIAAIKECKKLLDELPETNVKAAVTAVRKALIARAKDLLKELG